MPETRTILPASLPFHCAKSALLVIGAKTIGAAITPFVPGVQLIGMAMSASGRGAIIRTLERSIHQPRPKENPCLCTLARPQPPELLLGPGLGLARTGQVVSRLPISSLEIARDLHHFAMPLALVDDAIGHVEVHGPAADHERRHAERQGEQRRAAARGRRFDRFFMSLTMPCAADADEAAQRRIVGRIIIDRGVVERRRDRAARASVRLFTYNPSSKPFSGPWAAGAFHISDRSSVVIPSLGTGGAAFRSVIPPA